MHSTQTAINALPQLWTSLTILVVQISKFYLVKHLSSTLLWNTGPFKYQYRGIKLLSTNQWRRGGYVELVHINTRQADKTCMLRCKDIKFILLSWKLQKVFAKKRRGGTFLSHKNSRRHVCMLLLLVFLNDDSRNNSSESWGSGEQEAGQCSTCSCSITWAQLDTVSRHYGFKKNLSGLPELVALHRVSLLMFLVFFLRNPQKSNEKKSHKCTVSFGGAAGSIWTVW